MRQNIYDTVQKLLTDRLDDRFQTWDSVPSFTENVPNVQQAVDKFISALNNNNGIYCVHDSDADGVGSAALFKTFFDKVLKKSDGHYHRITNRSDGYGFLPLHVDEAIKQNAKLIITSDNGITSKEATDYAASKNIDVIITDHHTVEPSNFPDKAIIVDPQLINGENPFKDVSGTVVAYFFLEAVASRLGITRGLLERDWQFQEELGLTTISDVMKLQHMNRLFVKESLKYFNNPRKPYATVFKNNLQYENKVNSESIGFSLAPSLNAANRFGVAEHSYNFLTCEDISCANQYWTYLTHLNDKRKNIVQDYMNLLSRQRVQYGDFVYVNLNNVEKGILGLLANKLASKYNVPALVTCTNGDIVHGSGRSIGQVNMLDILKQANIESGGHTHAFGCSFPYREIPIKVKQISELMKNVPREYFQDPDKSDIEILFKDITSELYLMIESFEPFGHGYPKPIFRTYATVVKAYRFGKQKNHTKFILKDNENTEYEMVAFFEERNFEKGKRVQVNYKLHWDDYNNCVGARIEQLLF